MHLLPYRSSGQNALMLHHAHTGKPGLEPAPILTLSSTSRCSLPMLCGSAASGLLLTSSRVSAVRDPREGGNVCSWFSHRARLTSRLSWPRLSGTARENPTTRRMSDASLHSRGKGCAFLSPYKASEPLLVQVGHLLKAERSPDGSGGNCPNNQMHTYNFSQVKNTIYPHPR